MADHSPDANASAQTSTMPPGTDVPPEESPSVETREAALLEGARAVDEETPIAHVIQIAQQAQSCGATIAERVIGLLAKRTGTTKDAIKRDLRDRQDAGSIEDKDQMRHAQAYLEAIGPANLFEWNRSLWAWQPHSSVGVWRRIAEAELRRQVAAFLQPRLEIVQDRDVRDVTSLVRTVVHSDDQRFECGPADSVNTPNGEITYVNGTWQCREHVREHYRTIQLPVEFDPDAEAPQFLAFMNSVFDGDADRDDKIQMILEFIGYTLMPHCRYQCAMVLHGIGANGKSVLFKVVEALIGNANIASVQPSEFGNHFQRAHLAGRLANVITELSSDEVIRDDAFKALTAGESTTVEEKGKDPYDLRPFASIWIATNHLPWTRDAGEAFFRRVRIAEMNQTFHDLDPKTDPQIAERLKAELPGILRLALEAYANAIDRGFIMDPPSSKRARQRWWLDMNQVAAFCDECLVYCDGETIQVSELYQAYRRWTRTMGIKANDVLSMKAFVSGLEELGYQRWRTAQARYVLDVDFADHAHSPDAIPANPVPPALR